MFFFEICFITNFNGVNLNFKVLWILLFFIITFRGKAKFSSFSNLYFAEYLFFYFYKFFSTFMESLQILKIFDFFGTFRISL